MRPRRRRYRAGTAGRLPYPPRRPNEYTRCQLRSPTSPTPAGGPNAQNLGGTGAEPLSSQPPAKLSLHFLWWPDCQPRVAAGRLGASGGWRPAARLASQRLPVGRFAGWRGTAPAGLHHFTVGGCIFMVAGLAYVVGALFWSEPVTQHAGPVRYHRGENRKNDGENRFRNDVMPHVD